jgi:molybdenum cofactor cytidylyltransferase
MRFEEVELGSAVGAVLAHSHLLGRGATLKKGRVLTEADVRGLEAAGVARLHVARLEAGDLSEDEAARVVAEAVAGPEVTVAKATTGRANLFARVRGLLLVGEAGVDALNLVDERVTLATRRPYAVVAAGEMVATVKVIPFAVPASRVELARQAAGGPLVRVAPFTPKRAGLVLTRLGAPRETMEAQAAMAQRQRLASLGGELVREVRVPHDATHVAAALTQLLDEGLELILVLGASAIVDRGDVVPRAVERLGGVVEQLGMPVDPGNLLMLARRGPTPIVGVPGCARSLKRSGFDWVLERLAADVPITASDVRRMGAGGLLADLDRPSPRHHAEPSRVPPRVAAVVLAAGLGRRMGGANKLLERVGEVPIVTRVVDALLESQAAPIYVVVGHAADEVQGALWGRPVRFVLNPNFEEGLGASLRVGIGAVLAHEPQSDGALVALGDMPFLRPTHVNQLIAAFEPRGRFSVCVPVHERKRGHPVLWASRHFPELLKLEGDVGARGLMEAHADAVLAVPIDDSAIHTDVDTAEMLAEARARLDEKGTA